MIDATVVNIALPNIASGLNASPSSLALIAAGYTVAFACCLLPAARAGDHIGRRRAFVLGVAGFTVASLACGVAGNASVLVVCRFLQGATAAMMAGQTLAIIATVFTRAEQTTAFAIYGAVAGIASILGPNIGGDLVGLNLFGVQWRSIFLINLPLGLVAVLLALRHVPNATVDPNQRSRVPTTDRGTTIGRRSIFADRFDSLGAILAAAAIVLLVVPLTLETTRGWDRLVLLMLTGSVLLGTTFVRHESRRAGAGHVVLLRIGLFRQPNLRNGCLLSFATFATFTGLSFTTSLTLQYGARLTAAQAGLMTVPLAVGAVVFSALSSRLIVRWNAQVLSISAVTLCAGYVILGFQVSDLSSTGRLVALWPTLIAIGAGVGLFIAPIQTIVVRGLDSDDLGAASGLMPTVQQLGGALGLALCSALYFARLGHSPVATALAHPARAASYFTAQQVILFALSIVMLIALIAAARIPRATPSDAAGPQRVGGVAR